jgi:hypothetical protein
MYYLWIGQVINLIAVAVLKYSICAYLLALKFSKVYLGVVWVSILMITGFNLIVPIMGCFGTTPFEANWNKTIPGKHHVQIGIGLTYAQVSSSVQHGLSRFADRNPGSVKLRHRCGIRSGADHLPFHYTAFPPHTVGSPDSVLSRLGVSIPHTLPIFP